MAGMLKGQRLGDLVAETVVVRKKKSESLEVNPLEGNKEGAGPVPEDSP
jgi:uncharacterized RDD family membrane protein YckC